jgi:hypothetical protein
MNQLPEIHIKIARGFGGSGMPGGAAFIICRMIEFLELIGLWIRVVPYLFTSLYLLRVQ